MPTSTVPAALDALVIAARAAMTDVDVFDGEPDKGERPDWLAFGYSFTTDASVESWTQEARGLGHQGREERFDVVCSLGSSSGNVSMKERRDRAFVLLAEVEDFLRADGSLAGVVRLGEFTVGTLLQAREGNKVKVAVDFRITCQARV